MTRFIAINSSSTVYVLTEDGVNGSNLLRSTDGGATWNFCGGGNYSADVVFDSTSPATLYAAGIFGAYKSTDSCSSWSVLNSTIGLRDISVDPGAPTHLYLASYLMTQAAFVAKVDPTKSGAASLNYSSYYGATGETTGDDIAVDSAGNAFVVGSIGTLYAPNTALTNADGTFTPRVSPWVADTLLFKVGGLIVTSPSNPTAQSGAVTASFNTITTPGTTSIDTIDPATAGQTPGQFAISGLAAYDISTTATVSGPIVSCFVVSSVNDATTFANLRALHSELVGSTYQLIDRTILSGASAPNFIAQPVLPRPRGPKAGAAVRSDQVVQGWFDLANQSATVEFDRRQFILSDNTVDGPQHSSARERDAC
jgi:hypothetical protein